MARTDRLGIGGDSLSAGWIYNHSTELGGPGSWPQLLAEDLGNISGVGPLLGTGIRPVSLNGTFQTAPFATASEWTYTGSWTQITTTARDKGLYGYSYYTTAGTSAIATYNYPTRWRRARYLQLTYEDSLTTGDWSMRLTDTAGNVLGGAGTWFNLNADWGYTIHNDDSLRSIFLDMTSWLGANGLAKLEIRGATGGSVCYPLAVEFFWSDPHTTDGLIVDNYAQSGRQLRELVDTSAGSDRMALFDTVIANPSPGTSHSGVSTAAAIPNRPTLGVLLEHMNDAKLNNVATYDADIRTFDARLSAVCPVAYWAPYELAPIQAAGPPQSGIDPTVQAAYRAQMITTAAALGRPCFDMNAAFTSRGWANYAAAYAARVLHSDAHEAEYGHRVVRDYLSGFVRNTFIGTKAPSVGPWRMNQQQLLGAVDLAGTPGSPGSVAAFQAGAVRASGESVYT